MTVWLDRDAARQIVSEALKHRFTETGGPLFGYAEEEEIVVVGAGGPGAKARHRLSSFEPDHDSISRSIEIVHAASEGRYRYVGSWHTHPHGRPHPSMTDINAAREIAHEPEVLLPRPLVLIQATRPWRRTIKDRDRCAFLWSPALDTLIGQELRGLRDKERPALRLEIEWERVVT